MTSSGTFLFLSDENGINNRYFGKFDSTISFIDTTVHYRYFSQTYPLTNYSRSILDQSIVAGSDQLGQVIFVGGKYKLQVLDYDASWMTWPMPVSF